MLGNYYQPDLVRNPAKYAPLTMTDLEETNLENWAPRMAARIGLSLTATKPTVTVMAGQYQWVRDICAPNHPKKPFTDGCGEISPMLANAVWQALYSQHYIHKPVEELYVPPAFQVRVGPAKGVVSVNYKLQGRVSTLRKLGYSASH